LLYARMLGVNSSTYHQRNILSILYFIYFMDKPEQVLILVVCENVGCEGDEAGRTVLGHSMIRAQQSFQLAATEARLHAPKYL
jgi:hypothetical protein